MADSSENLEFYVQFLNEFWYYNGPKWNQNDPIFSV